MRVTLQSKVEDAVKNENLAIDGDLMCRSDLDAEPKVTASCEGSTESGEAIGGMLDGTANVDDETCSARLTVAIDGTEIVDEPDVDGLGEG